MGTSIRTNQKGETLTVDIKWDGVNDPVSTNEVESDNNTPRTGSKPPTSSPTSSPMADSVEGKDSTIKNEKTVVPKTVKAPRLPRKPRAKKDYGPVPKDLPDLRYLNNIEDGADNPYSDPNAPGPLDAQPLKEETVLKPLSDKKGVLSKIVEMVKKKFTNDIEKASSKISSKKIESIITPKIEPEVIPDIEKASSKISSKKIESIITPKIEPEVIPDIEKTSSPEKTSNTLPIKQNLTKIRETNKTDIINPIRKMADNLIHDKTSNTDLISNVGKSKKLVLDESTSSFKKNDEKMVSLLDKIFGKLEEIKTTLLKTGERSIKNTRQSFKDVIGKTSKTKSAIKSVANPPGVVKNESITKRFIKSLIPGKKVTPITTKKSIVPTLAKNPAPAMMALTKPKEITPLSQLNPPIANAVANTTSGDSGGGILDSLTSLIGGQSGKGLAGRLLPQIARFALPAVAVAGAGYTGYKAGEYLNEKMDGTKAGEIRDSAGQSIIASIDKLSGGMISGNKDIANELYNETDVGKLTGSIGDKFVKTKDAATNALTDIYGKSKDTATNITQTVPNLLDELDSQGIAPTVKQKAMVLGQLAHETGGFSKMEEGKYSADTVWKLRGDQLKQFGVTKDQVSADEKNKGKDAMYDYLYSDKYRSPENRLGNDKEGDAAKYKGRGLTQLTGKSNYNRVGKEIGVDLVKDPEVITKDPKVNAKVAASYIKNNKVVLDGLKRGDIDRVSQGINGGQYGKSNGAVDRINQTNKIQNGIEKQLASDSYSDHLERSALEEVNKNSNSNPVIVQQSNSSAPSQEVASRQPEPPPIMSRNPDSSLQRITEGQMSYGIS